MPFEKGHEKFGGRPPGGKNKRKPILERFMSDFPDYSPLVELHKFAMDEHTLMDDRIKAHSLVLPYLVPKPRPADLPQALPEDVPWHDKKAAVEMLLKMVGDGEIAESRALDIVTLIHAGIQTADLFDVAERLASVEGDLMIKKTPFLR